LQSPHGLAGATITACKKIVVVIIPEKHKYRTTTSIETEPYLHVFVKNEDV
jgi:hypothetical protein